MSVGTKLQKMENIEENVVTKGAKPGEPMQKLSTGGTSPTWEDLGGPTPENYKTDDNSAKLKTPSGLSQVKGVVNDKAAKADSAPKGVKEEEEKPAEVVAEEPVKEEEVVAEEPVKEGEEVVAEEEQKVDVEEDIEALIAGEELSEEFQAKARTIFETAIKAKAAELSEAVKSEYEEKLVEEVASIKLELQERVDSYLEYVADEWLEENKLAAQSGLKTEMTESFLEGMKSLFEEHYVSIPEDKYDVLENMVNKLDEMESKLNEQIESNVALNKRLAESKSDGILSDVAEGLAITQKEKLASLAESVEFESEDEYRGKLEVLKESYFSRTATESAKETSKAQTLSEGVDSTVAPASGGMDAYLQALGAFKPKQS